MEKPFSAAALVVSFMALIVAAHINSNLDRSLTRPYYIYTPASPTDSGYSTEQDLLNMEEEVRRTRDEVERLLQEELQRQKAMPVPTPRQRNTQPEWELVA